MQSEITVDKLREIRDTSNADAFNKGLTDYVSVDLMEKVKSAEEIVKALVSEFNDAKNKIINTSF